jgi:hypothetical protein
MNRHRERRPTELASRAASDYPFHHMSSPPCRGLTRVSLLDALVERDKDHDCDGFGPRRVCVKVDAVANLPSRFGEFRIVAFWNNRDGKEHIAMVHGDVMGAEGLPTRLHSECLTGDVVGIAPMRLP